MPSRRRCSQLHRCWALPCFPLHSNPLLPPQATSCHGPSHYAALQVLGKALGVDDWAVAGFAEALVRSSSAFALAITIDATLTCLRQACDLPPWEVISHGTPLPPLSLPPSLSPLSSLSPLNHHLLTLLSPSCLSVVVSSEHRVSELAIYTTLGMRVCVCG